MATVAGYRRVVMCQEARDEAEPALAPGGSIAALLLSMCERRLMPTPWLNKVPPAPPTTSQAVAVIAAVHPYLVVSGTFGAVAMLHAGSGWCTSGHFTKRQPGT